MTALILSIIALAESSVALLWLFRFRFKVYKGLERRVAALEANAAATHRGTAR